MSSNELHAFCQSLGPSAEGLAEILTREPKLGMKQDKDGWIPLHWLCKNINVYLDEMPELIRILLIDIVAQHASRTRPAY